jgi:thioredoxin-dependent peroxiredoxin
MPEAGQKAPDFELIDDEGQDEKLSDYRGKKVILYFYPQDFTSGCEMQACQFRDAYEDIREKNAIVLGVSPDDVESHRRFREALELPFHLLSDPDLEVSKKYGAVSTKTFDDGTTKDRVQRSHFVIDEEGKIVDAQAPVQAAQSKRLALEKL